MTNHYDVILVGGGMLGLATAYHLARRGARALVLEAGDLGGGSSARAPAAPRSPRATSTR